MSALRSEPVWTVAFRNLRRAAHRYHGTTHSRRLAGEVDTLADLPDPAKYPEQVVRVDALDRCYVSDGKSWVPDEKTGEAARDLVRASFALVAVKLAEKGYNEAALWLAEEATHGKA